MAEWPAMRGSFTPFEGRVRGTVNGLRLQLDVVEEALSVDAYHVAQEYAAAIARRATEKAEFLRDCERMLLDRDQHFDPVLYVR